MSELKAHRIDNIISAYKIGKAFCMKTEEEVYIKSEADKVIAEKDEELRRQKYRRCLAMAKLSVEDDHLPWNMKWHKRWLELAEKFKPNKQTAQQGKGKQYA